MDSEEVYFDIKKNDGYVIIGTTVPDYYAHVTAGYTMQNLTSRDIWLKLFFSFCSSVWGNPLTSGMQQAANTEITVNDKQIEPTYSDDIFNQDGASIASVVF